LRNRQFSNLTELNQAIKQLLTEFNIRPFQKQSGSRFEKFQELEAASLKPLPVKEYEVATFKKTQSPL
jgi:hypothetical protein